MIRAAAPTRRARLALALLLALAALGPAQAAAHAVLQAATPADGAVLARAPAEVAIEFNEPVTPIAIELRDASGAKIALPAPPEARDGVLRAALPPLAAGPYLLTYRVTSLDAHPVGGSLAFAIGAGQMLRAPPGATERGPAFTAVRRAVRAVHFGALLVAAGAAMFALVFARRAPGATPPPAPLSIVATSAVAVIVTALVGIGLQGATLLGPDSAVPAIETWHVGLRSTFGASALIAIAGAAVLVAGAYLRRRARAAPEARGLARAGTTALALGALGLVASLLVTGHVATAEPRAIALPALALHVLAAACWAGSLAALLPVLRVGRGLAAVERFSRLAALVVLALIAGAIAWSVIEIREPANLVRTAYGRLALAKIVIVVALLAIAALNRFRWLPAWRRGDARAKRRLRRSIAAELALIALAVLVTAPLSETPPPGAEGSAAVTRTARDATAVAQVTVTPGRGGSNTIEIALAKPDGSPLDAPEVSIEIDNEAAGIEPITRQPAHVGPGRYRLADTVIPFAGVWTIAVRARVSDFDAVTLRTEIPIR